MDRAIADLPAFYKEPLLLTVVSGVSQQEAADLLKTTPKAIEMRLRRARKKLAQALPPGRVRPKVRASYPTGSRAPNAIERMPGRRYAPSRRRYVQGLGAIGGLATFGSMAARAQEAIGGIQVLSGTNIDLTLNELPVNITGRQRIATAINNTMPGPILRLREGDDVIIRVTNRLRETSSIHWHGVRLPNPMDGVPGLTFAGIPLGETFTYHFPILQGGSYWYHSHSGMQEQTGLFGPLIFEPKAPDPFSYDREYVVLLSDWTDEDPMEIVSNLKQQSDYYNYHQRTLGTFIADANKVGLGSAPKDRLMWGKMRMSPTDIMDVAGATYTYLINYRMIESEAQASQHPRVKQRLSFCIH